MRIFSLWAWLLVCFFPVSALAQTYTIQLKVHPDAGKSAMAHHMEKTKFRSIFREETGKVVKEMQATMIKETIYTQTVLEKGNQGPRKYKHQYDKAVQEMDNKAVALPYQGRTILFERKDAKHVVTAEGKPELRDVDLQELAPKSSELNSDDVYSVFVAPRAVKRGESWTIAPKLLENVFGKDGSIDGSKSTGKAQLIRVYTRGDKLYGIMKIEVKLASRGNPDAKPKPPDSIEVNGTLDAAIDGSSTGGSMILNVLVKSTEPAPKQGKQPTEDRVIEMLLLHDQSSENGRLQVKEFAAQAKVQPPVEWKVFTSEEGKFSANFPGTAKASSSKSPDGAETHTVNGQLDGGATQFNVVYNEVPKESLALGAKVMLEAVAANLKDKTKSKKDIKIDDYPGVELVMEFDQGGTTLEMIDRIYIVNQRMYQVMATSAKGKKDEAEWKRFLDSFKLTEKKK